MAFLKKGSLGKYMHEKLSCPKAVTGRAGPLWLQREENMNCDYICRFQKSVDILPPASAERLNKNKTLNVCPVLRGENNLKSLLKALWDFYTCKYLWGNLERFINSTTRMGNEIDKVDRAASTCHGSINETRKKDCSLEVKETASLKQIDTCVLRAHWEAVFIQPWIL